MVETMAEVKVAGVQAIIHKATQGLAYVDPKYEERHTAAVLQDILWGAYHFGTGEDGIGQAEHFLNTVQPDSKTLVALDLESNPDGPSMTLPQAEAFVRHIFGRIGRWPVLYTGYYVLQDLGWDGFEGLMNCPLWIAAYGDKPLIPKGWANYTLWQYTNSVDGPGPHRFPGLTNGFDREQFNGSLDDLRAWWGN